MKFLSRLLLCSLIGVQTLFAQFGTDTFATSSNWTIGTSAGGGTFEFNSRLDYIISANGNISATWKDLNPVPFASDWTAVVDLHFLSLTLGPSGSTNAHFDLMVSEDGNASNYMKVYQFRMFGGSALEGFDSELQGGSLQLAQFPATLPGSGTDSALMISFNSTTKMLSSYVSAAPTYTWTPLLSVDIGSGTYAWGTGGFKIQLGASSASMPTLLTFISGDAYFSNFAVSPTAIPEPATYAAGFGVLALLVAGLKRRFGQQ
jgi:hypothetical protein